MKRFNVYAYTYSEEEQMFFLDRAEIAEGKREANTMKRLLHKLGYTRVEIVKDTPY